MKAHSIVAAFVVSILIMPTQVKAVDPVFEIGLTTRSILTAVLGEPLAEIRFADGTIRVRWSQNTLHVCNFDGQGQCIDVPIAFYDCEFGPDTTLKAWRSVDKSIPLDSSILFPAHGPVVASPSPASLALEKEFFAALTHDDLSTVKKLLIYTPDLISSRDEYGSTPLAVALINGHKDEAEFLLANHADINAREGGGRTLLHVLAMNRGVWAVEKAELLLANNADVDARDGGGGTPLNLAALTGNKDMAEWLLAHHADVNAKNVRGWTPLHQAARWGQKEIAELLLAHNADVNARDKEGKTPLQLAHAHRNERSKNVAEVLRQHGGR